LGYQNPAWECYLPKLYEQGKNKEGETMKDEKKLRLKRLYRNLFTLPIISGLTGFGIYNLYMLFYFNHWLSLFLGLYTAAVMMKVLE